MHLRVYVFFSILLPPLHFFGQVDNDLMIIIENIEWRVYVQLSSSHSACSLLQNSFNEW